MASNDTITVVLRGKTSYAKIVGDPRLGYDKTSKEWSMDLQLDKAGVADCKNWGISQKVKKKDEYLDGAPYIRFKRDELNKEGEPNRPIPIEDIVGKPWDDRLIGNGSVVDVKFRVKDYGAGKPKGVYIQKVRVLDLVPYDRVDEMPPVSEDDEYFAKYREAEEAARRQADQEYRQFQSDFNQADDDLDDPID